MTSSDSRDVARTLTFPDRSRIAATAETAAVNTCSQLSSTSNSCWPASASATLSISGTSPCGVSPSADAMAAVTDGGITDRRELDHPDAVGEFTGELRTHLEREPGLADTADAAQSDETVRPHVVGNLRHEIFTADERAHRLRQLARKAFDAPQNGELGPQSVRDDLVHRYPAA